jgi:hypothetical protein
LRYIPSGVSCVINFAHIVLICAYLLLTLVLGQTHKHAIVNAIWLPSEYDDSIACVCSDVTLSLWEEVAASQLTFISFRFYFFPVAIISFWYIKILPSTWCIDSGRIRNILTFQQYLSSCYFSTLHD